MALTLVALFLFSSRHLSLESSSLAVLTLLVVVFELFPYSGEQGRLGPADFLAGFGNPALITIVALLVCSKALEVTGALHATTRLLARIWKTQPRLGLLATMFIVAGASMFMNNTPLVAMALPVLVAVCRQTQTSTARVLMPVGFATIIGGMATTIGTSTNLLVADLVADHGMPRFGMFEFAEPVLIAGSISIVLIWLLAPRLLPDREQRSSRSSPRVYRGVLHVTEKSAAAGKTLAQVQAMTHSRMQIERIERGEDLFIARLPTVVIRPGDRIYTRAPSAQLKEYETVLGTPLNAENRGASTFERRWIGESARQQLAEIVVTSSSSLHRQSLDESTLLSKHGLTPIAIHSPRRHADEEADGEDGLESRRLGVGDIVLIQGDTDGIKALQRSGQALVLSGAVDLPTTAKALPAGVIMAGVVFVAALGLLPIMVSALVGVVLCIGLRCIVWKQVRSALDSNLIMMIVASLALGEALVQTGATAWLADVFVTAAGGLPPGLVIAVLMLGSALMTEVVTNNATAVLLTPLAFGIAEGLGLDAKPLVLAVMFGANMSYLTPLGYQTNIMVMNAGGYRFGDFFRLGLPLQICIWLMLSWLLAIGVGI